MLGTVWRVAPHTFLPFLAGFQVPPRSDLTHDHVRSLPSLILPGPHRAHTPARQAGMQSTERDSQAGRGQVDSGARDIEDIQVQGARAHDRVHREALVFIGTTFGTVAPAARTRRPGAPEVSASERNSRNSVLAEPQEGLEAPGKSLCSNIDKICNTSMISNNYYNT